MTKDKFQKAINSLASWIVIGFLLSGVAFLTHKILINGNDHNYMVVTDMKPIKPLEYKEGIWSAQISDVKIRPCIFIPDNLYGLAKVNGIWMQTDFFFTNDETPGDSRSVGKHIFDTWNWRGPKSVEEVKVIVNHLCHGKDIIETVIGPFSTQE